MDIRRLKMDEDLKAVEDLFIAATDYVQLETGAAPTDQTARDFFEDRPPGIKDADVLHLGLAEDGALCGLLAMSFGYPEARDSYIGLLLLAPDARGAGRGKAAVEAATTIARMRGADRMLVAVLDANPKAQAFWSREGFTQERTFPAGDDGHIRHRMIRSL